MARYYLVVQQDGDDDTIYDVLCVCESRETAERLAEIHSDMWGHLAVIEREKGETWELETPVYEVIFYHTEFAGYYVHEGSRSNYPMYKVIVDKMPWCSRMKYTVYVCAKNLEEAKALAKKTIEEYKQESKGG